MFKKMVPFNTQAHGDLRVRPVDDFSFAAKSHIASIHVKEFNRIAAWYPIVFLEEKNKFRAYALLGLKPGKNLFVDDRGKWLASYIPSIIRRYPFALGKGAPDTDQFLFCLDEESEFIGKEEGEPLVGLDGKPTEIVDKAKNFLSNLYQSSQLTERFCSEMAERELLRPMNFQYRDPDTGQKQNLSGCHCMDEEKLGKLPDEDYLAFRKRGLLPAIFAHLVSLGQAERMSWMAARE